MLKNNVIAIIIHAVISIPVILLFNKALSIKTGYIGGAQDLIDLPCVIIGMILYVGLAFFFMDYRVKKRFLSVSGVTVLLIILLICLSAWSAYIESDDPFDIYTVYANPLYGDIFISVTNMAPLVLGAFIPSLFMCLGISIRRSFSKTEIGENKKVLGVFAALFIAGVAALSIYTVKLIM